VATVTAVGVGWGVDWLQEGRAALGPAGIAVGGVDCVMKGEATL
jgi:hypothetical protein